MMQLGRSIVFLAAWLTVSWGGLQATFADERKAAEPERSVRWYKGNTHTHSLWSDGNDFPEMIVGWYRGRGYDFLGLSDHNILSDHERWLDVDAVVKCAGGDDVLAKYRRRFGEKWVETRETDGKRQVRLRRLDEFRPLFEKPGEFILIRAEEITDRFERKQVHINAVNLKELIPPQHGKSVRETIRNNLRAVIAQEKKVGEAILAHVNHPNFQWSLTAEDLAQVLEARFLEVYNGHPGIHHMGDRDHASDERIWDIANTIRLDELGARPLYGVATDDAHTYHGRKNVSPGRGWIMVRAAELSAPAIVNALRNGNFYASTGVTLRDVRYSPATKTLEIQIEPDGDAEFTTQFIGTRVDYDRRSKPVLDADGRLMDVTRRYSSDVGEVFETVRGARASFRLTGDELYLRATITSNRPTDNPSFDGQLKQAWTQPVGWEKHVKAGGGVAPSDHPTIAGSLERELEPRKTARPDAPDYSTGESGGGPALAGTE